MNQRRENISKGEGIDWECTEAMSYGSLLNELRMKVHG